MLDVLSSRVRPDGRRGFFHPDNFTFGQPLYLSQVYAAVLDGAGVARVAATVLPAVRQDTAAASSMTACSSPHGLEVVQLGERPELPRAGRLPHRRSTAARWRDERPPRHPDSALDDCGCCDGVDTVTPRRIDNPPGLEPAALPRRHGRRVPRQSMRARLSSDARRPLHEPWHRRPDRRPDGRLGVRARRAHLLRRAHHHRGLPAHRHRGPVRHRSWRAPSATSAAAGRAAATWLAFTLEDGGRRADRGPDPDRHEGGEPPGPGELPQTFETTADLDARPEWNAMGAVQSGGPLDAIQSNRLYVAGAATTIRSGEALLFRCLSGQDVQRPHHRAGHPVAERRHRGRLGQVGRPALRRGARPAPAGRGLRRRRTGLEVAARRDPAPLQEVVRYRLGYLSWHRGRRRARGSEDAEETSTRR